MRKRQKLVTSAIFLSLGLLLIQNVNLELRYLLIAVMSGLSWILAAWSLKEGLSGVEWLTVTLPSVTFTTAVGLFYILLPPALWARLIIALVFGIGEYALLLTANIFSVAAIRTIALFRAATAVGFVMTLVTGFFLFDTIFSFRLSFWATGLAVASVSFLFFLPSYWSVELKPKISKSIVNYSLWSALCLGFLAMTICFWPISISVSSLFVSTMLYVFLGIFQHHFVQRLFTRTLWEYLTVGLVVTITTLLTAGWGV
jgi:hypothetical protein